MDAFWNVVSGVFDFQLTPEISVGVILVAFLALIVGSWASKRAKSRVASETGRRAPHLGASTAKLFGQITGYAVMFTVVYAVLKLVGISFETLLVAVGGLSVGIGMASGKLVLGFFAGIMLKLERKFVEGSTIAVAGVTGDVAEIASRYTELNVGGNPHYIPNENLIGSAVTVVRGPADSREIVTSVDVEPNADPDVVTDALCEAAEAAKDIHKANVSYVVAPTNGGGKTRWDIKQTVAADCPVGGAVIDGATHEAALRACYAARISLAAA